MIRLPDPKATEAFGAGLSDLLDVGDVVALSGPLGAGKTSLARGILRGLGHRGEVASPTFPILLSYGAPETRIPVWHADLYRIEHVEEIGELGLDEAREGGLLLIEWPERLDRLWPDALLLRIEPEQAGRVLTPTPGGDWGERLRDLEWTS